MNHRSMPARLLTALWRSGRLRCPVCGRGRLFAGLFSMHPACSECRTVYQREPGFFLGAIYFNYGVTAIVATASYIILSLERSASVHLLRWTVLGFVVLFPIFFFRHARSLWLGLDQLLDPRPGRRSPPTRDARPPAGDSETR